MSKQHFALKYDPFNVAPGADERVDFTAAREARHRIGHLFELREIGLLTAEPGRGKITLCRQSANGLHPNPYRVCYVPLSTGTVLDRYNSIATAMGQFTTRARAFRGIQAEFTRLVVEGRPYPVLIFEEAHHLHNSILEELRILTNDEMDSQNRLCLLLVGLTELRLRILRMGIHEPLAGCEIDLFVREAIASLALASKGIPRVNSARKISHNYV